MNTTEYNQIVHEYANRIFRFALKSMHSKSDADEIVQITFQKLWEKRDSIHLETVKSWLFTTANRKMIDYYRKRKKEVQVIQFPEPVGVYDSSFDVKDLVNYALNCLNDSQRRLVVLKDCEGYTYEEIGDIMELSESQVKVYLYRARKKMQKVIQSLDENESIARKSNS